MHTENTNVHERMMEYPIRRFDTFVKVLLMKWLVEQCVGEPKNNHKIRPKFNHNFDLSWIFCLSFILDDYKLKVIQKMSSIPKKSLQKSNKSLEKLPSLTLLPEFISLTNIALISFYRHKKPRKKPLSWFPNIKSNTEYNTQLNQFT